MSPPRARGSPSPQSPRARFSLRGGDRRRPGTGLGEQLCADARTHRGPSEGSLGRGGRRVTERWDSSALQGPLCALRLQRHLPPYTASPPCEKRHAATTWRRQEGQPRCPRGTWVPGGVTVATEAGTRRLRVGTLSDPLGSALFPPRCGFSGPHAGEAKGTQKPETQLSGGGSRLFHSPPSRLISRAGCVRSRP